MDNNEINKFIKEAMAESGLSLTSPDFDDAVMKLVLLENNRQQYRKSLLFNILIFAGIELFVFVLLLMLFLFFPANNFISGAVKDSLPFFEKIGNLAIDYNYLILSFIVVGILDWILNRRERVSVKKIVVPRIESSKNKMNNHEKT